MHGRLRRWAPRLAAWLVAPALGAGLRLLPFWSPPGNTWTLDAAGHVRLVASLLEQGRLPDPDPLTDLPEGRPLGRFLPLALYHAAGWWHRVVAGPGGQALDWSSSLFTALAGALVAWPVWIGARAAGAGPWGAAVAALVVVAAPAHLLHTTAFQFRFEAPGTLLVAAHVMLGAAALGARTLRRAVTLSALSALALLGALAVWRVPLVVPVLEAAVAAALAIARGPSRALRVWMLATALALAAACAGYEYLRIQSHLLSVWTLAVLALAAALWWPPLRRPSAGPTRRAAALLPPLLAIAAFGAWHRPAGDYDALGRLFLVRGLLSVGVVESADPITAVLLSVRELQPMPVPALWGRGAFSWIALWLAAAPVLLWLRSGRSPLAWAARGGEATWMLVGLTVGVAGMTLLALRHRVLLAPLVSALAGVCASSLARPAARAGAATGPAEALVRRPSAGARPSVDRALRALGAVALVPCLGLLLADGVRSATGTRSRLDPGWEACLAYLRHAGTAGAVLAPWERGYELQYYAGRATFSDGMLESPVNRGHIVAAARALLARTPDSLAALCAAAGVRHVVVPPSWALFGVAMAAGDPLAFRLAARQPLTPQDADRVITRMMFTGARAGPFEPVFARGGYRLYRRVAGPPPAGAADP